ncbi:B3 domain-containing protein Os01g0234100-like isoform X2 [Chenopodium quinoa]|uniref:B3 domain-containing protein Os01g0234100-like isoform X2 n=1 Tax=Chenopodium quinoa TaxID=63459 RepID=UPI000B7794EE|nr:B3 domain-containing protein Os01g0234100-like isoform X2 [Chenopodium quinoa]
MGADNSSKKASMSKTELKAALVAKRLAMLEDDQLTPPVLSIVNSIPCERHKQARIVSDNESSEDKELMASTPPRKKGSTKRKRIKSIVKAIGDPRTPKLSKKKRIKSNDLSIDEKVKATNNSRAKKIQRMDLSVPLSMDDKSSSMKRAEEVQANLSAESPSFLKTMLKSHITGGFWLGLPRKFCDEHLPIRDCTVVLVDEAGKGFDTVYLAGKGGLSGGWRGFSIYHELLEGDVLVFHLIERTKFKIYIIREQSFGEVDGALGLLTLDSRVGEQKSEGHTEMVQTEDNYTAVDHLSLSSSDVDLGSEVLDGIRLSDSSIKFEGVSDLKNFNIIVDGLILDSKFNDSTRKKYYELCCNQRSFLHERFLKGLNCHLVVGIISETVNIADAIRSYEEAPTSHEDLQSWEKTLRGFELLGMKVEFLLASVNKLLGHSVESEVVNVPNMLKESIIKRALAGERMKALENKLRQLKESLEKIDFEMDMEIAMASSWKKESKVEEIPAAVW